MTNQNRARSGNQSGFTLIELSIVLVIVGLLVGVGSGMIGMLTTAIKVREAKDTVTAVVQSVTSWAATNNRLPPLSPTSPDTATFAQAATSSKDSWGRDLIYIYDANLAPTGANLSTKDTICGRRSTSISSLTDQNTGAVVTNVAFLVLSKSDDASVQTTLNGILIPGTGGAATGAITLDSNNSDIVRWVTLDELRTKVGCQGAQMKIVNNELPFGSTASPYSAIVYADGGVPFAASPTNAYKWCVEVNNRTAVQGVPGGLAFCSTNINACTGTAPLIRYPSSSQYCANQAETSWPAAFSNLYITSGATNPTETGSFSLTIYVRDNNASSTSSVACNDTSSSTDRDNCVSKPLVLTISPAL
jgi:prepilin-type N-terminal cleavage/methylation domain-containing protein